MPEQFKQVPVEYLHEEELLDWGEGRKLYLVLAIQRLGRPQDSLFFIYRLSRDAEGTTTGTISCLLQCAWREMVTIAHMFNSNRVRSLLAEFEMVPEAEDVR